jgi:hypothetical protein
MDEPPVPEAQPRADMIDSKSESNSPGSDALNASQRASTERDSATGTGAARELGGPPGVFGDGNGSRPSGTAPGLREQLAATRDAALRLVRAHVDLARAEFADIVDEIKKVALLAGLAIVALFTVSLLLPIGLSLFIGETLFGSMGWGILHGTLFFVALAMAALLLALGAGGVRVGVDFAIAALIGLIIGLILALNLANRLWVSLADSLVPGMAADVRPFVVGAIVAAAILGLLGLLGGARGGGAIGAFVGAVALAILGAIIGAVTALVFSPRVGAAIGVTIALLAWPITMGARLAREGVDTDELRARFWPDETIEITEETIEWVRERTPLGRRS